MNLAALRRRQDMERGLCPVQSTLERMASLAHLADACDTYAASPDWIIGCDATRRREAARREAVEHRAELYRLEQRMMENTLCETMNES